MHSKRWEELIPFYVAGTLSRRDAAAFERHLATCAQCRRDVSEWSAIASAVRAESASQLRDLPPLAPDLQARISGSTLQGGSQMPRSAYHTQTAPSLSPSLPPLHIPVSVAPPGIDRERRTRASRIGVSLSLAAAAAMVIGFAVLLAARTMDNLPNDPENTPFVALSGGSETPPSPTQPVSQTETGIETLMETEEIIFATATPSRTTRPPATATATITPPQSTPTQQEFLSQAQVAAEVIVTSTTINLRGGPGTNYPILETGNVEDRFRVIARVGSGTNTWYMIERPTGGTAWVFGTIVRLEPADAQIPPASDIPDAPLIDGAPINATNTPAPAETTPQPSPSAAPIRGGNWMHLTTVVEHQCGGAIGTSNTVGLFIVPSLDLSTVTVTYTTGVNFTLFRTTAMTYSGSYPDDTLEEEGTATVSVSITFNAANSYTGQETILHENGCIVRSTWVGSAVN